MLKPFANSARALAAGPLTWKTWTGLIIVPVIVMGLLTWALWSPEAPTAATPPKASTTASTRP
jgi:putative membrane protein